VSVVVIGRNEGARLQRCLVSVAAADWGALQHELIYVDSGSTDGSVQVAQGLGATVLVLDDAAPNAAKGRNLGWRQARGPMVLFLDGDTELHPGFVQQAHAAIDTPRRCAVWGHRRESAPQQSVYTRVLDLDWVYPVGETLYFGGDVLVRREQEPARVELFLQPLGSRPGLRPGQNQGLGLRQAEQGALPGGTLALRAGIRPRLRRPGRP